MRHFIVFQEMLKCGSREHRGKWEMLERRSAVFQLFHRATLGHKTCHSPKLKGRMMPMRVPKCDQRKGVRERQGWKNKLRSDHGGPGGTC